MKTRKPAAGWAIVTVLAALSSVHAATVQTVNPLADGYIWDNASNAGATAPDGTGDGNWGSGTASGVGELDETGINRLEKMLLKFNLPAIPEGEQITSVVLRVYMASVSNNGSLGDAMLYHRQANLLNNLANNYYEVPFLDGGVTVATPTTPVGYVEINVMDWVQADYQLDAAGAKASHFRIQIDSLTFVNDDKNNRYTFREVEAASGKPELVITSAPVPEAATLGLLSIGGGMLLCRRR